jgi:hypothetical protein
MDCTIARRAAKPAVTRAAISPTESVVGKTRWRLSTGDRSSLTDSWPLLIRPPAQCTTHPQNSKPNRDSRKIRKNKIKDRREDGAPAAAPILASVQLCFRPDELAKASP